VTYEIAVEGALDVEKLHNTIAKIVQRHEILRTVFHRPAGLTLPLQVILESSGFAWQVAALHRLIDDAAQRDEIEKLVSTRDSLCNLEKGPCLHVVLAILAPQRNAVVLSLPALCADLTTMQNLVGEILRSYTGASGSEDEVLQYADVAEWQQELEASDESKTARDFWRDYGRKAEFSALDSALLPFEKKPAVEFAPHVVVRNIELQSLDQFIGPLLRDYLLACWQVFLARITGRPRILSGCQFDGRSHDELRSALGAFAKYLPLASDCSCEIAFRAVFEQVQHDSSDFRSWQDSFSWSNFRQEQEGTLPTAFEFSESAEVAMFGRLKVTTFSRDAYSERFKLKLAARRQGGQLRLEFHFDSGCLDRATVERWAANYMTLLHAAARSPDSLVGRLPLVDEAERRRLLVAWNQTAVNYPREHCIHDLFEEQAAKTPDLPALRYEDECLTYRELNERANQLAYHLRSIGVKADLLVGVCVDRSTAMMVAVLAVLKAGGAYVALNADHPKPRLAQQLAGTTALITESKFECLMPAFDGVTVLLDKDSERWSSQPTTNPAPAATAENLVYVMYTSGSTGTPKGVAVRHRNLVNYTSFIEHRLKLEECAQPLHFATVSTLGADLGNTCIYPSLVSGGCLHVIGYDVAADSQRLRQYMAKYPVDVLKIVPSHLTALLNAGGGREVLPRKYLVMGGEALTPALMVKIELTGAECEILNHYGPTETTVGSLTLRVNDYDWKHSPASTIPIGFPIGNTRIYILDIYCEPAPVGVAGELYIGGDGVSAGYIGQPELTAERFVPERFGPDPNAKIYRTGDLARYLPDGNVEFLGRADDQVKVRGFRVELGEIESLLLRHSEVKQAVALALTDERGDKFLVAYVVGSVSADELRRYLREALPDYMVPTAIISLPKLPLNANGKVDRSALPKPDEAKATPTDRLAPRTPSEEVVAAIWEEVLKRDCIGVDDNFFEIGGHSLLATQIASRLREHFNLQVPVRAVFEAPSIAELAKRMDTVRREEQGLIPPPIKSVQRNGDLPLSYAQERLWVLDQMEPNSPLYNIARTLRLKGTLKVTELERALNEIVRRHESQRTVFTVTDGHPVQVVLPNVTIPLTIHNLASQPEDLREAEARRISGEEAMRPFDLKTGPLLRAHLMRLAPEDHVLQLTMHHIVSDAWSAAIFLEELGALYEAFCYGRPSPLSELTVQYADYAAHEREWLQDEVLAKQLAFWRERLKGIPPLLELPLDHPRPSHRTFAGAYEILRMPAHKLGAVKDLARQEGATLFMILMAAFQGLLSRYSGQEQIVVGTDLANRTMPETERMIGFFINLMVVRADLSGNPTFRELLRRVREGLLESYAHQEVPFPKIVQEIRPERSATQNPIVQVLFVMQNTPQPKRELAGVRIESFAVPVISSKFDMALFVTENSEELIGFWVYGTELFDHTTIQRMSRHYQNLLESAVAGPDTRLSALPMLSTEDVAQQEAETKCRKQSQFQKLKATVPEASGIPANDTNKP